MTPHLDEGRIAELLDGEIPSPELAAIRAHLAACPDCAAKLASAQAEMTEADELITLLDEPAPQAEVIPIGSRRPATRRDWLRRAAWAASLVVAAGAGYLSRGPFMATPSPRPTATSEAIEATRPAGEGLAGRPNPASPDGEAVARESVSATNGAAAPPEAAIGRVDEALEPPVVVTGARQEAERRPVADAAAALADAQERAMERTTPAPLPINALNQGLRLGPQRQADSIAMAARTADLRDPVTSKQLLAVDTIDMAEAVERLGGSIRLVDGRFPVRIEAVGDEVRVVYGGLTGEFRLAQSRIDDRIVWRLVVPAGFPAESLAAIRRRIND